MSTLPAYTEAEIRRHAGSEIFDRGRDYYDGGMVQQLLLRGDTLTAEVEGSQYEPYQVSVHFTGNEIVDANCTCPYDWGGWCKHIVAALLAARQEPETIEARPPVTSLIEGLDREQLATLLLALVAEQPALVASIESWLAQERLTTITTPASPPPAATVIALPPTLTPSLDKKATRQEVRQALRGMSNLEAAQRLLDQVQTLLIANDGRNAWVMLEALTDEFIKSMPDEEEHYHDYYGDYGDDDSSYVMLEALDAVWAELILSLDLNEKEPESIAAQLEDWSDRVGEQGGETPFSLAQLALEYGWDYEPLQRAMSGNITEQGAWAGEAPYNADELAQVRLTVLERQGRTTEYLNLAQAEGQLAAYVIMLAKVGRVAEAVGEGQQFLQQTTEFLHLAQTLYQQGATAEAIQITDHGLAHGQGDRHALAQWLRDRHLERGDVTKAIPAAIIALAEQPAMAAYQQLQHLADDQWSQVRSQALAALRGKPTFMGDTPRAEIFLSEELWDDAIQVVDGEYGSDALIMVMKRVYQQRPDWVIRRASKFAESIMDAGKAQSYDSAVAWLAQAKQAYLAAGRGDEWRRYLEVIRTTHQRKYKLINLLKHL
jgi:uncharacterized Zn finger protein